MSDLNVVNLFGRVVKDAELKTTPNKLSVAVFSIACNKTYRNSNGELCKKVDFFPLALYGNYAEKLCSKLKKGQKIIVEGSLKQNKWESNGARKSSTGIGVRRIQLIFDSKVSSESNDEKNDFPSDVEDSFEFTEEQTSALYNESENYAEEIF